MRDYDYYYAPKIIYSTDEMPANAVITKGTISFGIRVQNLLMKANNFYKECGFLTLSEVQALSTEDENDVSALIISTIYRAILLIL